MLLGSPGTFRGVASWLIGTAALLFALAPPITKRLAHVDHEHGARRGTLFIGIVQASVHGGSFGAGMALRQMATMAIALPWELHEFQGLGYVVSMIVNSFAAVVFIIHGHLALEAVYMPIAGAGRGMARHAAHFAPVTQSGQRAGHRHRAVRHHSSGPQCLGWQIVDNSTYIWGMKKLFSFPNPVNDASARTVALGVVTMSVLSLATNTPWLLIPLTYGFLARVATGPTLSPLGQFAVRVAGPRLRSWQKSVPGPPKRFAQGIGAAFSVAATCVWLSAGWADGRWILVPLIVAASLEGFLGYCLGCTIFGWMIRVGVVPESICLECGDLSARYNAAGYAPK